MIAYNLIKDFYKDNKARRSQVPLINHIDEGLKILDHIGADNITKEAYCLHPLSQSDTDFLFNKNKDFGNVSTEALILTMEYRRVANSYLSKNKIEEFVGLTCDEIRAMLIADKVQNYKDFMIHHYGSHERSDELYTYFHNWFNLLSIEIEDYKDFDYSK